MQCSAYLAGLFQSKKIKRALVVAPKTLLLHWEKEMACCQLGNKVFNFYGSNESERRNSLDNIMRRGGILLTTYGMVLHNVDALQRPAG